MSTELASVEPVQALKKLPVIVAEEKVPPSSLPQASSQSSSKQLTKSLPSTSVLTEPKPDIQKEPAKDTSKANDSRVI